jgi:predicted nucleic acid-binding protein
VYLLDTNVISEMRRLRPNRAVATWLAGLSADQIFIAAATLGELQAGVEMTRRQDPPKAQAIEAWIDDIADSYAILPMDGPVFRRWAQLMHRRSRDLMEDAMIAATAAVHNLTVATRNLRDFDRLGVAAIDPFRLGRGL